MSRKLHLICMKTEFNPLSFLTEGVDIKYNYSLWCVDYNGGSI